MPETILSKLITISRTRKIQQPPATFSSVQNPKENKTTASPPSTEIKSTNLLSFYTNRKTTKLIKYGIHF